MRNVKYGNSIIGHVYGAGTDDQVSAGVLQFDVNALIGNKDLSVFADDKETIFSIADGDGVIRSYDNGNSILCLEPDIPRFRFQAGIQEWPLKLINSNGFDEFGTRIYQKYYDKPAGESVRSFTVSMRPAHDASLDQQDYFLSEAEGFRAVTHRYSDSSMDVLKYDAVEHVLSYTREKKLYSCPLILTDNGVEIRFGLSSSTFNTLPEDAD